MPDPDSTERPRADRFVDSIHALLSTDNAAPRALASGLRPWSGEPQGAMHKYVAPWLPAGIHPDQERAYYTVAALMTTATRTGIGSNISIGAALGRPSGSVSSTSSELAMRRLTRFTPTGPYTHLRGALRLTGAASTPVDWARLLSELETWHFRGRRTCTQWQQDYYRSAQRTHEPDPIASTDSE